MLNINVSYEAQELINTLFGVMDGTTLVSAASAGTHVGNPYHNVQHALHVVYWSHAIATNENSLLPKAGRSHPSITDLKTLAIAALFHDHNHSGGALADTENVQRAIQRVFSRDIAQIMDSHGVDSTKVRNLIRVTCYEGLEKGFRHVPKTLLERAIRDADLMMVYTAAGRTISSGLAVEVARSQNVKIAHGNPFFGQWVSKSQAFLEQATMFTLFGKEIRERYLLNSIHMWRSEFAGDFERIANSMGVRVALARHESV